MNNLKVEEALEYIPSRVRPIKDLYVFNLLEAPSKSEGRNDRTWSYAAFAKKHYEDWQDKVLKYNPIFNLPPLTETELRSTVLKSNEKKTYAGKDKEKISADPTAWRKGMLAKEIRETVFPDIPAIVEGLIYPGITFLCGKSKIGKSFLVLLLAWLVETGGKLFGRQCVKGKVLHYSLEDGRRRDQSRWKTMDIQPSEAMYQFRDRKPKIPLLTKGLEEEIEDWIKNTPDAKLVIIDPYVKVKKTIGGHKLNSYENDNFNLQNLYTLANKYNIAIVIIHHTKKQAENDVFDEINGSAGIQSNADSMIVIASDRKKGVNPILHCLPKDAEQQEFEIKLNEKCHWEYAGKVGESSKTKLQKAILDSVKKLETSTPLGAPAASIKTEVRANNEGEGWSKEHIQVELDRLLKDYKVAKPKRGFYRFVSF